MHWGSSDTVVCRWCYSRRHGILYWVRSFSRSCLFAKLIIVIGARSRPSLLLLRLLCKLVIEALLLAVDIGGASTFDLIIRAKQLAYCRHSHRRWLLFSENGIRGCRSRCQELLAISMSFLLCEWLCLCVFSSSCLGHSGALQAISALFCTNFSCGHRSCKLLI